MDTMLYAVHCGAKHNYHVCGIFSTLEKARNWITTVGKTEYDSQVFCIVSQELDREFSYGNDESLFCWSNDTWYADVGVDDVPRKVRDMGFPGRPELVYNDDGVAYDRDTGEEVGVYEEGTGSFNEHEGYLWDVSTGEMIEVDEYGVYIRPGDDRYGMGI